VLPHLNVSYLAKLPTGREEARHRLVSTVRAETR
jgi:hypothetical protein